MNSMNSSKRGQVGFTIIEALVSLIIMGFGIFALAGMQTALSNSADIAKQRTEAVRLAEEKIESLRSYTGIASTLVGQGTVSTSALNWNALAGGTETIDQTTYQTNTSYTRTWTLGGAITDSMRALTVSVAWTDRANAAQVVSLSSVLSQTDPADSGFLGFPLPLNTNLKRPKNRSLDIPIPAIDLGTGKSAIAFGAAGQFVTLDNIAGNVVQLCTPTSLPANPTTEQVVAALTNASTSNCTSITGYLLAGYVAQDSSVSTTDWNAIQGGLGIDYSGVTRNAAGALGISCQFGDALNQSTGAVIAGYKYYVCVIPLTAPSTPPASNGPYNWSGKILIAGPSVWHGSGNKYYVCRYQYAPATDLTNVNQMNMQPYVNVNVSLDQQNYLIATTSGNTDPASPICPSTMNVANVSTGVLHQDCRSASNSANYAADCPLVGATTQSTLTYNGNTNTGGTAPTDARSPYTTGAIVTTLAPGTLVKTGNNFAGWNTAADGSGTSYAAGSTFTIAGNTTLYAKWIATLTYNGNTNTGGTAPTDAKSPYTTGAIVTTLEPGTLVKTGNNFAGWNTAADGSGMTYTAGSTFAIAGDTTLYAKWTTLPVTYTVAYNGNGSTGGTAPTDAKSPYTTGAIVTTLAPGTLVKTGNNFAGWNTAADGSGMTYTAGSTFAIAGNTTLYAKWIATLTYNGNTNTGGTAPTDAKSPYTTGAIVTTLAPGTLMKDGNVFTGWNTLAGGTGTSYAAGATFTIAANTTLYAQWTSSIRLDTPAPAWTGGSTNPNTLTWPAVPNATGYFVGSCSTANHTSLTSCSPTAGTTPQNGLSVSPTPANKFTYCYNVFATGLTPYTNSYTSNTFCIYVQGQSYTYTPPP